LWREAVGGGDLGGFCKGARDGIAWDTHGVSLRGDVRVRVPRNAGCQGGTRRAGYFRFASIQSTVAWICSSVSAGLPPLGGMIPPSGPVYPSSACL